MAKTRYFSVVGTIGKNEYYMLLRAGPRSLNDLSDHYFFNTVENPKKKRIYQTTIISGPKTIDIKVKVGKKLKASFPGINGDLELMVEEIYEKDVNGEIKEIKNKRMVYQNYAHKIKENTSGFDVPWR